MYSNRLLPSAVSHRGLRSSAPENTIDAFNAAIEAGADGIELDVHSTLDGVVFVHHDPVIDTPSGRVAFRAADSKTIKAARLESDHPVPTLDATLDAIRGRAKIFIEIKPPGIEHDVVRCLKRHSELHENYAVHSFDHRIARRMLELLPSVRTGILQVAYPIDSRLAMRAAGASDLWQHADFVDAHLVADVHAAGGRIIVWTPNTAEAWERLASLGVDGICTDHIGEYVGWRAEMDEERGESGHPANPSSAR